MSSEFLKKIEFNIKTSLFTDSDLMLLFRDKEASVIYNALTYHLKKQHLVRYKRGLYSLAIRPNERHNFSKFSLANKLALHSFISFESALSHHNLIPEAVYEITSATYSKNLIYHNSLGRFSFTHVEIEPFYLGVEKDDVTSAKIANPIRALFDLIYSRRKIYKNILDLENDFRVDVKELQNYLREFKSGEIMELGELYKKSATRKLANILVRELM